MLISSSQRTLKFMKALLFVDYSSSELHCESYSHFASRIGIFSINYIIRFIMTISFNKHSWCTQVMRLASSWGTTAIVSNNNIQKEDKFSSSLEYVQLLHWLYSALPSAHCHFSLRVTRLRGISHLEREDCHWDRRNKVCKFPLIFFFNKPVVYLKLYA